MPKAIEKAELVVNNQVYSDWETVWVHQEYGRDFRTFRFTASEDNPPRKWSELVITPGDFVDIILAGQKAVHGYVYERQASYDSNRHGILIAGQSAIGDIARTSVLDTHEYKGWAFDAIARSLLSPYGFNVGYKGAPIDSAPFKDFTVFGGETPFEAIDRMARHRGGILGDDSSGKSLVVANIITPGLGASIGVLTEGQNIISARATVVDLQLMGLIKIQAQEAGSDEAWGAAVAQNQVFLSAPNLMERGRYKPYLQISEHAANMHDLRLRGQFEIAWRNSEAITAQITINGWLRDDGQLWQAMDNVLVRSPMLALNQSMIIQAVTFTQDNNTGSRTMLELANLQGLQFGGALPAAPDEGPTLSFPSGALG